MAAKPKGGGQPQGPWAVCHGRSSSVQGAVRPGAWRLEVPSYPHMKSPEAVESELGPCRPKDSWIITPYYSAANDRER